MKKLAVLYYFQLLNFYIVSGSNDEKFKKISRQDRSLLFPQYTTLQTSMCLIAQISSLPSHRVALNLGFQTNYALPYELPSFYSPIFWARKLSQTSNPLVNFFERMVESDDRIEDATEVTEENSPETTEMPENVESSENKSLNQTTETHSRRKRMLTFESDISAGHLYYGIIDLLEYAGYHEDCLLKSVCELAKHPLEFDDDSKEDVTYEILHFLLTPSAHQSFDPEKESDEKELYEEAERIGKEGGDCELIYSTCKVSPLYSISNFIEIEN